MNRNKTADTGGAAPVPTLQWDGTGAGCSGGAGPGACDGSGTHHDQDGSAARAQRAVRPWLPAPRARPAHGTGAHRHLPGPPGRPRRSPSGCGSGRLPVIRNAGGRVTPAVIDDVAYLAFLAGELFGGQLSGGERQGARDTLFEVAIVHHTQCGTGLLADAGFRRQAAEATGLAEAELAAAAVADPHVTVKADVERLLTSPLLTPKVSVSGHVYDVATGRVTTVIDARYR